MDAAVKKKCMIKSLVNCLINIYFLMNTLRDFDVVVCVGLKKAICEKEV